MGIFERYLSIWVGTCIVLGVALGTWNPEIFGQIAQWQWRGVNLMIAVLIWAMIYPMMIGIDFSSLKHFSSKRHGLLLTIIVNWLIKPFSMALLGAMFFKIVFADLVEPQTANEYIAGMILLGVAPCTAMVFVWSHLTQGDPNYTLVQVSVNDLILIFAFAPLTSFLLGINAISVPWGTLISSVGLYVLFPLAVGLGTRAVLLKSGGRLKLETFTGKCKPFSMIGLLLTVIILFGLQADTLLAEPLNIALIAVPLLLQTYGIFMVTYIAANKLKLPFNIAAPASMIATSNFFELAVAVAVALFGLHSGAALATVVGVLVEVPVMLSLVAFANRTRHWFSTPLMAMGQEDLTTKSL